MSAKITVSQVFTRLTDIVMAIIGLTLMLPMLPWIALLIKLDSKGPVFYRCDRVGLDGKIFKMYKFRTMYDTPVELGSSLSSQGDPRVTPVGRMLRRLKLNEFPQFINILQGEMTLIGPRPEAPDLAAAYPEAAKKIFSVKPGLAGPCQILGRNEEELYPDGVDPVKFYIEYLLPQKLPLDLEYIEDRSVFKNFKYLFLSVWVTASGAISRRHLVDNRTQIYLLLCDSAFCLLSFSWAHFLRYDNFSVPETKYFPLLLLLALVIRLPLFIYFGFYHTLIRHLSFYDIKLVFKGVTISSLALICFSFFSGLAPFGQYSRAVYLIDWVALIFLLSGYRILLTKLSRHLKSRNGQQAPVKRVLIWGAGDGGELCLRYLQKEKGTHYEVVGFIDDAPKMRNRRLNGVKVLGNRHHLEILSHLYRIEEVFVAMPSVAAAELQRVMEICHNLAMEAKLFQLNAREYSRTADWQHPMRRKDDLQPALEVSPRLSVARDLGK